VNYKDVPEMCPKISATMERATGIETELATSRHCAILPQICDKTAVTCEGGKITALSFSRTITQFPCPKLSEEIWASNTLT